MEPIDSKEFGARVRQRREELEKGQEWLGKKVDLSQQQIAHIEQGKPKKPGRLAADLADALWTTREWLCWGRGPVEAPPAALSPEEVAALYNSLPREDRAEFSRRLVEAAKKVA